MLLDISKLRRIEGLLLTAWNDARERMKSPLVGQKMASYTFTLKDGTLGFIIGIKGMSSMNEIMQLILSEELIGSRFSPKYLRSQLDELLSDLVKADPRGIQKQTNTLISKLIHHLTSIPIKNWKVGIPIINLELREPSFKLGSVIFANYNSDTGKSLIKTFSENFQTFPTTDEVKKFTISKVTENFENSVIATINVNAVDGEQAIMIGATEIEFALYVILFYGRTAISNDIISNQESEDFEEDSSANTRDNNGGGIYWAGICSKLDFFIIEPCENLVTNNGYDLTDKGKRVAACIAGGGLLTVLDPSMQTLLAAQPLGKAVGCSTLLSELGGGGVGGILGALG